MFKDVYRLLKALKTDVKYEVMRVLLWFWGSEPLTALQKKSVS